MFSLRKVKDRLKNKPWIEYTNLQLAWYNYRRQMRIDDFAFAKERYKNCFGTELNLENPTHYNEKLWYLKLNNRNPLLTKCSDKLLVRDYVKECGLQHILTNIYGSFDDANEINFESIKDRVFIKCNHVSGTNIIYDRTRRFDKKEFIRKFNFMLKQNYYWASREWNYKDIKPKILIEEYLENHDKSELVDYRFMCFNGKVKLVFADIGTCSPDGSHAKGALRNIYDENFNLLDIKVGRDTFDKSIVKKPDNFNEMVQYAEILSRPFTHVRVDFYNINGRIYFGEMTFYHGGCSQKITPDEWSRKIGSWIDIKTIN